MSLRFQSLKIITDKEILPPADYLYDGKTLQNAPSTHPGPDETLLDCSGLLGSRGWTDLRCFSGEPGEEYRETLESLAKALAQGGITEAVIMPNTQPPLQSKNEVAYVQNHTSHLFPTFHIQAAVTRDFKGEGLTEMLDLNHYGIQVFGEGLVPLSHSDRLMKALQYLQRINGVLFDQSQDPMLALFGQMHEGIVSTRLGLKGIPDLAEEVAVQKNLEILRYTGGRLHFQTVSTRGALQQIRQAKAEGLAVTADISIYQLLFTDEDLLEFDTCLKVMPPFRGKAQREALLEGLKDGTIDALVSNHVPHDNDAKNMEFDLSPFGMSGLPTFVPALVSLEEELGYPLLISKLCSGPQKVLGKEETAWDTLTVFDPEATWTLDHNSNASLAENSPFWGKELKGKVKYLINREKTEGIHE
ncbi:dihydroorotase [Cyclobacterium plantarum]|uniref:Dihydroorotase n=1 Tax=Cyclobacterium plantarum TaxID=2716263 RepID=A0ABX0HGW1_9BACT|nr:dihydroorotase [Cyclobacterium plantarum]NHE59356.1 dihydroorotase [Cyclobacterium plantarum]